LGGKAISELLARLQMDRRIRIDGDKVSSTTALSTGERKRLALLCAVLDDRPEDTDVFHILSREPKLPEYITSRSYIFRVDVDGRVARGDARNVRTAVEERHHAPRAHQPSGTPSRTTDRAHAAGRPASARHLRARTRGLGVDGHESRRLNCIRSRFIGFNRFRMFHGFQSSDFQSGAECR